MSINHTPDWYRDHCKSENCNPILRKKLKEDCRYIGGDPDSRLRHIERVEIYETRWSEVMNDPRSNGHLISEMGEVMERELSKEIDRYNKTGSEIVD